MSAPAEIEIEYISGRTAVYRLYGTGDVLLYVGVSNQPEVRWKQHAAEKDWWPLVTRRTVAWCDDRDAALRAEARAIEDERPTRNLYNPLRPLPRLARRPRSVRDPKNRSADRHVSGNGISLRLDRADFDRFEKARKAVGLSRSRAIITAIREYLDRNENSEDPE